MSFITNNHLLQKKVALGFFMAIFFITLDRLLKIISLKQFNFVLISDFLKFNFVKNYFIAFSIPLSGNILNYLILLIIVILIYYLLINRNNSPAITVAFLFITLGAASNLFDRFVYGYVIDYLSLKWFTVFNIADIMIVCSIFFLLIFEYKKIK